MRFINKKNSRPIVPIVSLIDILAILLIYFILTSSPKEDKSFASITLPKASSLAKNIDSYQVSGNIVKNPEQKFRGPKNREKKIKS